MKYLPEVSVVMTVFNSEKYLEEAVKSILDQTLKNIELIIVDDASTDNGLNILRKFNDPRIHIFKLEKNYGPSYARNYGIKEARANYVALMDSDDVAVRSRLQLQYNELKNGTANAVFSEYFLINDCGEKVKRKQMDYSIADTEALLLIYTPICCPTVMIEKKLLENISFNNSMRFAEDYDLWCRLIIAGVKFHHLKEPLLSYRIHDDQSSGKKSNTFIQEQISVITKNYAEKKFGLVKQPQYLKFSVRIKYIYDLIIKNTKSPNSRVYSQIYKRLQPISKSFSQSFVNRVERLILINLIRVIANVLR